MSDEQDDILKQVYCPYTGRAMHYRLVGQSPVPCSLEEWCKSFADPTERRVRLTHIGPFIVSTVFLGLDHNFSGKGAPILFETMTFLANGGDFEGYNECDGRRATWPEAEKMHDQAVAWLQATYCHAGEQPEDVEQWPA